MKWDSSSINLIWSLLQAGSVLLFHETDASACRNDRDRLVGELANDIGHPVARISGIVLYPLAQDFGQARSHSGDRGIPPETADHAQPCRNRLMQQRAAAGNQRLLLQWDPDVRRIAAKSFAEKSRRRHANHRKRVTLHDERRADDRWVGAVRSLPRMVAQHDDRRR